MDCFIVGFICLIIGTTVGMFVTALMTAASDDDRCKDCTEYKENKEEKGNVC